MTILTSEYTEDAAGDVSIVGLNTTGRNAEESSASANFDATVEYSIQSYEDAAASDSFDFENWTETLTSIGNASGAVIYKFYAKVLGISYPMKSFNINYTFSPTSKSIVSGVVVQSKLFGGNPPNNTQSLSMVFPYSASTESALKSYAAKQNIFIHMDILYNGVSISDQIIGYGRINNVIPGVSPKSKHTRVEASSYLSGISSEFTIENAATKQETEKKIFYQYYPTLGIYAYEPKIRLSFSEIDPTLRSGAIAYYDSKRFLIRTVSINVDANRQTQEVSGWLYDVEDV